MELRRERGYERVFQLYGRIKMMDTHHGEGEASAWTSVRLHTYNHNGSYIAKRAMFSYTAYGFATDGEQAIA